MGEERVKMFLKFISDNIATIAVLLVLCAIVGLIIFFAVRKKKKKGGCSCGCGCSGCPMKGECKHSLQ
jgi:LPXTG-motif cell wall-anchored protein